MHTCLFAFVWIQEFGPQFFITVHLPVETRLNKIKKAAMRLITKKEVTRLTKKEDVMMSRTHSMDLDVILTAWHQAGAVQAAGRRSSKL